MAPLPRRLALPVLVALLSVNGCCARGTPPCPCEVARGGHDGSADAPPVDRKIAVADTESYYGVPVHSDSVLFVIDTLDGGKLVWRKHGQLYETNDGGKTWTPVPEGAPSPLDAPAVPKPAGK